MRPHIPDWLAYLLDRPVAVLGGGVSGKAAAGLVAALGGRALVYDLQAGEPERRVFGGIEAAECGLVITSPGFAPDHEWLRVARSAGCEVLSELDFAALAWPGKIIAVTGTNGKTTICGLLGQALRQAARDVRVVGNVGAAFSDASCEQAGEDSIAVCEVSSFQAETLRFFEADATIWSNFAEDHLERHGSLDAYFRAKFNLVKRTRDHAVLFGPDVLKHAKRLGLELPAGNRVPTRSAAVAKRIGRTPFARPPQLENFLLVRAVWADMDLADDLLIEAAQTFRLGAHRLARTSEVRGITFWNDSKATNFHAAEAALAGFDNPVAWIAGGRSKGGDLAGFASRAAPHVRHSYLIGDTAAALETHLRAEAVPVTSCKSMRDAVSRAFYGASAGDHVVLSPGFASFDMFQGYEDRGHHFEAAVAELATAHRRRTPPAANSQHPTTRSVATGLSLP